MKLRSRHLGTLVLVCAAFALAQGCSSSSDEKDVATDPGLGSQDTAADLGLDLGLDVGLDTGLDVPDSPTATPDTGSSAASRRQSAATQACTQPVNDLVINEFSVYSASGRQWIEIYNPTALAIDLKGWTVGNGTSSFTIPVTVNIAATGYALLCSDGDAACSWGPWDTGFALATANASITLQNKVPATVNSIDYSSNTIPATGGTIELKNAYKDNATLFNQDGSLNASFSLSTAALGTPGVKNDNWVVVEDPTCSDDGNICTFQVCEKSVCTYVPDMTCCQSNSDCQSNTDFCLVPFCNVNAHKCENGRKANCCTQNSDCNDNIACTTDYCLFNQCQFTLGPDCCIVDSDCPSKGFCSATRCGTVTANHCTTTTIPAPACCTSPTDCKDDNPCTFDNCDGSAHKCVFKQIPNCCLKDTDCNDGNPCTLDTCVINACRPIWQTEQCCYDDPQCAAQDTNHKICTDDKCVLDSASGHYTCITPFKPDCALPLPYIQLFNNAQSFTGINWELIDYGTSTSRNWSFAYGFGDLGPDGHLMFNWSPTVINVKTVAVTPTLDASTAANDGFNSTKSTTLQWRMAYHHKNPGATIKIRVRISTLNDFSTPGNYKEVYVKDAIDDVPYALYSYQLPAPEKDAQNLRVGFMLDTGTSLAGTASMDSLEVDDVKVASGVPSRLWKYRLVRCTGTEAEGCDNENHYVAVDELDEQQIKDGQVPSLTAGVCDWYRVYMCMYDQDGSQTTWNFFGFPSSYIDGPPMDQPSFIQAPYPWGENTGCSTFPQTVQGICNSPLTGPGYYVCALDIKPDCCNPTAPADCAVKAAGAYLPALVTKDEDDPGKQLHSPFETQTKFAVTLLIQDGYLVWSPNGRNDPAANAIANTIMTTRDPRDNNNFRKAQIVVNLNLLSDADLARFRGVFAVLGVSGNNHVVSVTEAATLKRYMDQGGRMYLEGGDFFYTSTRPGAQFKTVLHDLFNIDSTSGGLPVLDGPIAGRNFLDGYSFDYVSGSPHFNSYLDRLVHRAASGSREIMRNAGTTAFATAISFESTPATQSAPFYRTIGSSILFGGLVEQTGHTTLVNLMSRYLDFLEVGYPDCLTAANCQDDEACTSDTCLPANAENHRLCGYSLPAGMLTCTPCKNDVEVKVGNASVCGLNEACNVALGYCVPIPFQTRFDAETGTATGCGDFFGDADAHPEAPASSSCTATVTTSGILEGIQVKAKIPHLYRGDVQLSLTSPSGTEVRLKPANPLDAAPNIYATYDVGVPSDQPLSKYLGERLLGAWTLKALDTSPTFAGGTIQEWHLYTRQRAVSCTTIADCGDDPCAANVTCEDTTVPPDGVKECKYQPLCDDSNVCTLDVCTPGTHMVGGTAVPNTAMATGSCAYNTIPGANCSCTKHDDCLADQACLNLAQTATCAGEVDCRCAPVPGTPHELSLPSPLPIPDNDAVTGVTRSLTMTGTSPISIVKIRIAVNHPAVEDLRARVCHLSTCVTLRNVRHKGLIGGVDMEAAGFHDVYDFDAVDGPGTLQDFRRLAVAGAWTVTLFDVVPGNTGTLRRFNIYTQEAECFSDSDCSDNNACSTDTCRATPSGAGICLHTFKVCPMPALLPGISADCVQTPQCVAATGVCPTSTTLTFKDIGTACEDGLFCTANDTCDATGHCLAGGARDCSGVSGACTEGWCDPALSETTHQCQIRNRADGFACNDGEACNGADSCLAGVCKSGTDWICPCQVDANCVDDGNLCNGDTWFCNASKLCQLDLVNHPAKQDSCLSTGPCQKRTCEPATGLCKDTFALANYFPCDDNRYCTLGDYCLSGVCMGGDLRDCSTMALPDGMSETCGTRQCVGTLPDSGCQFVPEASTKPCDTNSLGCDLEHCSNGACINTDCGPFDNCTIVGGKATRDCTSYVDDCNTAACQELGGGLAACKRTAKGDGTTCTPDAVDCTTDTCQAGICKHDRPATCPGKICGGRHPYDAGDDMCGLQDSCVHPALSPVDQQNGLCTTTCDPAQDCQSFASGLVDLPIIDWARVGTCATSSIVIPAGYPFTYVKSLQAKVRLSHSYLGDLFMTLKDPQGYTHPIWNMIGGANDGFADTFELSFNVPNRVNDPGTFTDGRDIAGAPMCSFQGELARGSTGTWTLEVCDYGLTNSGVLHDWTLAVQGTNSNANLNSGHRCEDAIDLTPVSIGPDPLVWPVATDSTKCGINVLYNSGYGKTEGPERWYKMVLDKATRVKVTLNQPIRDLALILKGGPSASCATAPVVGGSNAYLPINHQPEYFNLPLQAGTYFLAIDTVSDPVLPSLDLISSRLAVMDNLFNYGPYIFDISMELLRENGNTCGNSESCLSNYCDGKFCCDNSLGTNPTCCPGAFPADGESWTLGAGAIPVETSLFESAKTVCGVTALAVCHSNQPGFLPCEGRRVFPNCSVGHDCFEDVSNEARDDTACTPPVVVNGALTGGVTAYHCGYYDDVFCDAGLLQTPVTCKTECASDADCKHTPVYPGQYNHCEETNPVTHKMECVPDRDKGERCGSAHECISEFCGVNNLCCIPGKVCCPSPDPLNGPFTNGAVCPDTFLGITLRDWTTKTCSTQTECIGQRTDPFCSAIKECVPKYPRDDCGCQDVKRNCTLVNVFYDAPECFADAEKTTYCADVPIVAGIERHGPTAPDCFTNCLVTSNHVVGPLGGVVDCSTDIEPVCNDTGTNGLETGFHCLPDNPSCCCQDDSKCIYLAHCAPVSGALSWKQKSCDGPIPNGGMCNRGPDCVNKNWLPAPYSGKNGGYCNHNVCCNGGNCCLTDSVPGMSTFCAAQPADCNDPLNCHGRFFTNTCNPPPTGYDIHNQDLVDPLLWDNWNERGSLFTCTENIVSEDDTQCTGVTSNTCPNYFASYVCKGSGADDHPSPAVLNLGDPDNRCRTDCNKALCVKGTTSCLLCYGVPGDDPNCCPPDNPACCCEDNSACNPAVGHCDPNPANQTISVCAANGVFNDPCNENSDCGTGLLCLLHYCCTSARLTECKGYQVTSADLVFASAGAVAAPPATASLTDPRSEQFVVGEGSPVGRVVGASDIIDLGFAASAVIPVQCYDLNKINTGIKGPTETDINCGGAICPPCDTGKKCIMDSDCKTGLCDPTDGLCHLCGGSNPCHAPKSCSAGFCG